MLVSLAYILLLGLLLGQIFEKLKLPSLLGMLITGVVLGPYVLNVISPTLMNISVELRQIALVIILLRAGLALDFRELRQVGRTALLLCFLPACFEIVGMVFLAPLFLGVSMIDAAIMGAVVAAVSPAIIVPRMLRLMEQGRGTRRGVPQMIMAAGSVDDVFVIVLFTLFTGVAMDGEVKALQVLSIPISIVLGVGMGLLAGYLMHLFFKRCRVRTTVKVLVMLSVAFLLLYVEVIVDDIVPFSGLLAVMFMGVSLLRFAYKEAKDVSPSFSKLWIAAEVILFVLVGSMLDLQYAWSAGLPIVCLVLSCMLIRVLGVYLCTLGSVLIMKERLFCMIAYLPKATIQAAIGGLPLAMGLPCGQIVLTVAVLSIVISAPLGALGIDWASKYLLSSDSQER